jgi:hypothetical protein
MPMGHYMFGFPFWQVDFLEFDHFSWYPIKFLFTLTLEINNDSLSMASEHSLFPF